MKLTKPQQASLLSPYERQRLNEGGPQYPTYLQMRRSTKPALDGCAMVRLWSMWLGIETDGYCHS